MSRKASQRSRKNTKNRTANRPPDTDQIFSQSPAASRRSALAYVLMLWALSRLVLTAAGAFIAPKIAGGGGGNSFGKISGHAWWDMWAAWDSKWYYHITEFGYAATHELSDGGIWAWFPLYPWLSRLFAVPLGSAYAGMLVVSNLAIIVAAYWLYQFTYRQYNPAIARRAVLCLFVFPTAYVFACMLTESLFIACTIGAWYFARRRCWWAAGLCAMGAVLTRFTGVLMAPILTLEYLRQCGWRWPPRTWALAALQWRWLWIGLIPAGLAIFMFTEWYLMGNPWAFVDAQSSRGERGNPFRYLFTAFMSGWDGGFNLTALYRGTLGHGYSAWLTLGVLALLLWQRKNIGALLFMWSLAAIALSFSVHMNAVWSVPRFLAVLFPVLLAVAFIPSRAAFAIVAVFMAMLQVTTYVLWSTGHVIAV